MVGDDRPPILEQIDVRQGLSLLAVAPGGDKAAVALIMNDESKQSTILLYGLGTDRPAEVRVNGLVRDLLFAPDGMSVFGLLHRPAKKREGETYLLGIGLDPAKSRRLLRAPPSARALDYWPARNALLIAARNEIRTLKLPDLRSGPLYRILGENLAVASLGRGGRILVGQESGIVEVDLNDPPGETEMPARDRLESPEPVVSLAAAVDGSGALARLADGSVHAVVFSPLRIDVAATSAVLAERARGPSTEPEAEIAAPAAVEPEAPTLEPEPTVAEAEPEPTEPEPRAAEPEPGIAEPASAEPEPAAEPPAVEPEAAASGAAVAAEPGRKTETEPPPHAEGHQVSGHIDGPAADRVAAVVLLGPDNILREAQRVQPGSDGWWWADGLQPGRYRIQLDGGGETVLLTQPPFVLLEVETGKPVRAAEIRVLEAL
jgi:hypothetical protein